MKLFGKVAFLSVLSGAFGACGGGGSGSRVDTGLAESTALRDVTSADAVTACQNIRAAIEREFSVDQTLGKACELFGAALTDDPAMCRTQADSCVTQTNDGTNAFFSRDDFDFAAALECDGDTSDYADCDVTVGELESCMEARLAQVEELFSRFSCDRAASIGTNDAMTFVSELSERETPPACQRLQMECPRAEPFSDEGETDEVAP